MNSAKATQKTLLLQKSCSKKVCSTKRCSTKSLLLQKTAPQNVCSERCCPMQKKCQKGLLQKRSAQKKLLQTMLRPKGSAPKTVCSKQGPSSVRTASGVVAPSKPSRYTRASEAREAARRGRRNASAQRPHSVRTTTRTRRHRMSPATRGPHSHAHSTAPAPEAPEVCNKLSIDARATSTSPLRSACETAQAAWHASTRSRTSPLTRQGSPSAKHIDS